MDLSGFKFCALEAKQIQSDESEIYTAEIYCKNVKNMLELEKKCFNK